MNNSVQDSGKMPYIKMKKPVDKHRKRWYDVKVASGKPVRTENNFEKS